MSEPITTTINRSVVIVRPKSAFIEWLGQVEQALGDELSRPNLEEEGTAYLIPDETINDAAQAVRYIEARWRDLFEHFLIGWVVEESLWPQKRSLKMFREWFECIYAGMVWDLDDKTPLEIEDWDDPDFEPEPSRLH